MVYLLEWFAELSSRRPAAMGGINPISDHQLLSWAALSGTHITYEEIAAIFKIDAAYRSAFKEQ